MNKKKENRIRKCVVTNTRQPQEDLLRIVRIKNNIMIDATGKQNGRGAYITPSVAIINQAKKKNSFARAFKMHVDLKIYDDLLQIVTDGEVHE